MRVFKTTYKDRKGHTKEAAAWYVEIRDQLDTVRRLPAFQSKAASEEMGRNLEKLIGYHKASGGQCDPALTRFLAGLPARTREKLVAIGLLARDRVATAKLLADHLADFAAALTAKGNSVFHVEVVTGRARRLLVDGCGFRFYGDLCASKVMERLHALRADADKKPGISAQTSNFYLQAVKQFCRWMVKDRRAVENPLAHLDGLNVKTDRRRDRRAFTVEELRRLLDAARNGPERHGIDGTAREVLYWLAVETGLRSNELRSLTRASFDLHADPPTVIVEAAYSKHRREDTLSLRPVLAAALGAFLAAKTPEASAFRVPTDRKKAAKMFRADVEAAGILYRDDAGRVADFHSLRHTFITNLANAGVHPKTAQTLARHSTITLTMDNYSHTLREQEADALAVLPDLSPSGRATARATGTDGPAVLASCLALSGGLRENPGGAGRLSAGTAVESQSLVISAFSAKNPEKQGPGSVCTPGVGPGLQNQGKACLKPRRERPLRRGLPCRLSSACQRLLPAAGQPAGPVCPLAPAWPFVPPSCPGRVPAPFPHPSVAFPCVSWVCGGRPAVPAVPRVFRCS
jgi:integrase